MTDGQLRGRLLNHGGEIIAEGLCWVDEPAARATMEPDRHSGAIRNQRGEMTLELDSGRSLRVSDRAMLVRVWPPTNNGTNGHRSLYRLRLVDTQQAQDANAAGGVGEGTPTVSTASRRPRADEETPAAR